MLEALSVRFLAASFITPDLLVYKQQVSSKNRYRPPFSDVRRSNPLLFCRGIWLVLDSDKADSYFF